MLPLPVNSMKWRQTPVTHWRHSVCKRLRLNRSPNRNPNRNIRPSPNLSLNLNRSINRSLSLRLSLSLNPNRSINLSRSIRSNRNMLNRRRLAVAASRRPLFPLSWRWLCWLAVAVTSLRAI